MDSPAFTDESASDIESLISRSTEQGRYWRVLPSPNVPLGQIVRLREERGDFYLVSWFNDYAANVLGTYERTIQEEYAEARNFLRYLVLVTEVDLGLR